jgi:hypothetical protein
LKEFKFFLFIRLQNKSSVNILLLQNQISVNLVKKIKKKEGANMRKFKMEMPDVMIGQVTTRTVKNQNKEPIGERVLIDLEYMGGFVRVDVDRQYSESLKAGSVGKAYIEMEPSMSGRAVRTNAGNEFAFIDTGFDNFRLVGFEANAKVK